MLRQINKISIFSSGFESINRFFASRGLKKAFTENVPDSVIRKKIYLFYHICTIKKWKLILDEQFKELEDSGLMAITERIYIGSNGPNSTEQLVEYLLSYKYRDKIVILHLNELSKNENETINFMTSFAKEQDRESCFMLYFHSKGVTEKNDLQMLWRKYMMFVLVNNYKKCVKLLEFFNTVGCIYLSRPHKHYSGNFFWTKSEYLSQIPLIKDLKNRYKAEQHILSCYKKYYHITLGRSWYFYKIGSFGISPETYLSRDLTEFVF
jgi:hypothetical protein